MLRFNPDPIKPFHVSETDSVTSICSRSCAGCPAAAPHILQCECFSDPNSSVQQRRVTMTAEPRAQRNDSLNI